MYVLRHRHRHNQTFTHACENTDTHTHSHIGQLECSYQISWKLLMVTDMEIYLSMLLRNQALLCAYPQMDRLRLAY